MSNTVHVNVGGTWKTASNYYVNVGGTWKTGSDIGPNVSSTWKGFTTSIYTTNLKLHLDADNSSSYGGTGTTWTDLTSEDNDATIDGATFTYATQLGGVFDLDGTDDYISVPDDASIEPTNVDWTFEAWINVDSGASGYNTIFAKNAPIQLYWNSNKLELYGNDTDSTSDYDLGIDSGTNSLAVNGWHHIVVSRASNVWKIYIDKVEKVSQTASFTVADTTATAYIGNYGGSQYFFNGKISQVRIYQGTGLSATQVADNYDATKDIVDLKFHLDGDDNASYSGSGTTWYDLTSNDNDGTIDGATFDSDGFFDFDGTDDHVEFPDSDDWHIDTDYTVECWFNTDATSGSWDAILGQWKNSNNDAANSWILEYVGTTLYLYYIPSGSTLTNVSLGTPSTNAWHHFALTRSGTTAKVFLDNSQVGSDFTMNTLQDGTGVFTIGGDVATGGWYNGQIAVARIYKGRALSTSDISANYNAQKSRFGL